MSICCIILAAGFGTRLASSISNDPSQSFLHLLETPKPLLPLNGSSICERWIGKFLEFAKEEDIVVISNSLHFKLYESILSKRKVKLINDGATDNENRLGAVADIEAAIISSKSNADFYCVVAGDTLLDETVNIGELFGAFVKSNELCGTVGYKMKNPAVECKSRGILVLQDSKVTHFVEKPEKPLDVPCLASAPLYFYRNACLKYLHELLKTKREEKAKIGSYDAPGFLLQYLTSKKVDICCFEIPARIDIGSLEDYIQALQIMKKTNERYIL